MNSEESALIIESTSTSLFCFFSDNAAGTTEGGLVEQNTCCFDQAATQS